MHVKEDTIKSKQVFQEHGITMGHFHYDRADFSNFQLKQTLFSESLTLQLNPESQFAIF